MRRMRLEWLFRLIVEPGRLWRRYIVGNPLFLARVLRQKIVGGGSR
jgi:UDP-N-acetyl-D-mannosaminuronic acid transferase (WecB/TagA/CpsF family)